VVAEPEEGQPSILERLIARMTQQEYWQACEKCDLKGKCYAYHNARTFQDPVAGPKVIERLKMLYTITHCAAGCTSLCATCVRRWRSCWWAPGIATAFTSSTRTAVRRIRTASLTASISIPGLAAPKARMTADLALLREIDVAEVSNPDLDRELGFLESQDQGHEPLLVRGAGRV
jgi:hypothetical protein